MKRLMYEAIREVVAYLDDERKDYEARKENGEPPGGHIWKSVKILAAYQVESGAIITEEPICTQCGDEIKRESEISKCDYCSKPHCGQCVRCWYCSDDQTKLFVCRPCHVFLSEAEAEQKKECPHRKRLDYLEACERCKENYCGLCLKIIEWLLTERRQLKSRLKDAKAGIDERLMNYEERQALHKVLGYLVKESDDCEARKEAGEDVSQHIWESMIIVIDYLELIEHWNA